ncbi:MAG: dNTP triphosphohydrolase, partial [Phycisphaerales bacterium]|nr:dNTP triphosphohydrolase [Phycisphaerales bacterium]
PVAADRNAFQRDRARVLHCSAFRRLDYKTQVFVPHWIDHFRTRLTHSLEVAQVARDLARMLGLNEDLAETVALAHDLGHPPFGHVGEVILAEMMADHGGFEHNLQSVRIVEWLEHPYPEFRGLNLTDLTRECIAGKHHADLQIPLEGQLVDLADEIAYTTADLEDALAAHWLTEADLADEPLWQRAQAMAAERHPGARDIHLRIRATKNVMAILCADLREASAATIEAAGVKTFADVRNQSARLIRFSDTAAGELASLKRLLHKVVYQHANVVFHTDRAETCLRELFAAYMADAEKLPPRYAQRVGTPGLDGEPQTLPRVACDFLAGMTDRFCQEQYAVLDVIDEDEKPYCW